MRERERDDEREIWEKEGKIPFANGMKIGGIQAKISWKSNAYELKPN